MGEGPRHCLSGPARPDRATCPGRAEPPRESGLASPSTLPTRQRARGNQTLAERGMSRDGKLTERLPGCPQHTGPRLLSAFLLVFLNRWISFFRNTLLLQKEASVKGFLVWKKAPTRSSVWELPSLPPRSGAGLGSRACSVRGKSWPNDPEVSACPQQGCERRCRPPHTPHPGPRCLDGQETRPTPTCPGSRRPPTIAVPSVNHLIQAGVGPHPGTGRQRLLPERSWGHTVH